MYLFFSNYLSLDLPLCIVIRRRNLITLNVIKVDTLLVRIGPRVTAGLSAGKPS